MSTPAPQNVIITKVEIGRFTVYLVCLMVSVLMQMQMDNQATMNSSVQSSLFSGIQNIFTFDNVTRFSLLNWVDKQLYHGYSLNQNTTQMYDRLIPITFLEIQTSYAKIDTLVNVWDKDLTEIKTLQGYQQQYAYPYIVRFPPYPVFLNISALDDVSGITLDSLQLINTGYLTSQVKSLRAIASYYSPNLQMICVVRINLQFSAAGQAVSTIQYDTFRLSFYDNLTDYTRMVFEIIFALIYINYLYMEGYKIYFKIQVALKDDEVKQAAAKKKESRKKPTKDSKKRGAVMQNDDGEVQQLSVKGEKDSKSGNQLAEEAQRKTKILINVVINHITDIWSAIDVFILVLLGISAAQYIGAISSNPYSNSLDSIIVGKQYQDIFNDEGGYEINNEFAQQADALRFYRRLCGVALLIMWIKLLKYFINIFSRLMSYLEIILSVIEYMIFYLVLLAAILVSFALFFYFEYGSQAYQTSTIGRSLNYILCFMFAQNDQFQIFFKYNEAITFIMTLIYYVIVIIILCNMFFVFVKSEYNEFQKKSESEKNKKGTSKQHDEAVKYLHPFWQIYGIAEYFVMRFWFTFKLQPSKFDEYMENKELQYVINEREFKENAQTIDFNVDFANLINQSVDDDSNQKFLVEEEKERILSKQKMELIKLIWKTVLLIGILSLNFILLQEFYSPGEAFQQRDSIQRKIFYDRSNAAKQFKDLMTLEDMTDWLINGFPDLFEDNLLGAKELQLLQGVELSDNNNVTSVLDYQKKDYSFDNLIKGSSLNTFNFVVNNVIRVTMRRSILTNNTQSLFKDIAPQTKLLFLDSPDDHLNSENENYENFIYNDTQIGTLQIDYDSSNGIDGNGGLVMILEPKTLSPLISNLRRISFMDTVSSLAIEFVIFNPFNARGLAQIKLWFTINQCGVLSNNQIDTLAIKKNSLQNISEISILILSVSLIIALCYYLYITIKTMLHKNFSYDRWYSTYILLSLSKSQLYMRERHMPEFIRKSLFLMDISQLLNLLFLTLLGAQITLILYYFFQANALIQVSTIFDTPINDLLPSTLFTKPVETDDFTFFTYVQNIGQNSKYIGAFGSCAILVLCLEILYLVSHNKNFQVMTNSIKYTLYHLPFILIILFGIIVAFSSMGHLVLGTDVGQFSTFFGTIVQMLDYIQTINDISIIRLDDRTLEFYLMIIPYTITVRFIIMNMFFAITLRGYLLSKEQQNEEAQNIKTPPLSLTPQEFVMLSIQMITFKEKLIKIGSDQYLMQIIKQFQPLKVYTAIKDNIRNQTNLTAMKAWAEECAKEIKDEKEIRKPLDVACHELLQAYIDSNNKGEFDILQRLNTDPKRKLIEFSLKLTYINYFRQSIDQLDKFTVFFTKKREQIRNILFSDSKGEDYKQMVYICSLEAQLEENIQSMTFIRQELLQLGFDIGEAGEIDSKENLSRIKEQQRQTSSKSFFQNPLTNKLFQITKQQIDTPKADKGGEATLPVANSDSEQPDQQENQFIESQILPKPSQFKQAQTLVINPEGEKPVDQTTEKSTDEKAKSDQQKQSDEKKSDEKQETKKVQKNIFKNILKK